MVSEQIQPVSREALYFQEQQTSIYRCQSQGWGGGQYQQMFLFRVIGQLLRAAYLSINILELRAICLALFHFQVQSSDSILARSYINTQGGLRSLRLLKEALKLQKWAGTHVASLQAEDSQGDCKHTSRLTKKSGHQRMRMVSKKICFYY